MIIIPESIKSGMLSDNVKYNIRLHFPNGERTDICNNMIVNGSAKFTESLCSQDSLKFGLCESPTFECETVGVGNITGAKVELTYEIICNSNVVGAEWRRDLQKHVFPIKKGLFVIASAERQPDIQHRKIVAYGGGAATDWEMPFQTQKLVRYFTSSDSEYTCDVSKIISQRFNCPVAAEYQKSSSTQRTTTSSMRSYYGLGLIFKRYSFDSDGFAGQTECVIGNQRTFTKSIDSAIGELKELIGDRAQNYTEEEWKYLQDYVTEYDARLSVNTIIKTKTPVYYNSRNTNARFNHYDVIVGVTCYSTTLDVYNDVYFIDTSTIKLVRYETPIPPYVVSIKSQKDAKNLLKIDLQQNLISNAEMNGVIVKIGKNNDIDFIDIKKQFYLMPSDDLQPSEDLQPLGVSGASIDKSQYSSLWYEETYTKPYGAVTCSYKNTSNADAEKTVYLDGYDDDSDLDTYQIYDLSDNEIVKENKYTATQMTTMLNTIAEAIKGVSYIPVKLKCVSIPFVEVGDTLEVLTQNDDSVTTIVLKRTLTGESYVTDEITSV